MAKSSRSKGLRGQWSQEQLENAIESVTSGMSVKKASETHNIPRRTLRNHIKSGSKKKSTGRKTTLTDNEEKELVERIIRFCDIGFPLTRKMIQAYVYEYAIQNNLENQFSKTRQMAGRVWMDSFLKRHPEISIRRAQTLNPARAQKLNPMIVDDHFGKLKTVMDELDLHDKPNRIFNLDEKACRLTLHKQQQVLAKRGAKRVHLMGQEHGENVTIVACVSAAGYVPPPMIIFKGKRSNQTFGDDLPPMSKFVMSEKGSMTNDLFIKWLDHFNEFKPSGRVLLIFDGAACHLSPQIVDAADKYEITLYCLPSNTTHELQPLDKSVFRSFEHYWDEEVLKFWRTFPGRNITKERFGKLFTPCWNRSLTIENVMSGFRVTGIYPFDKTVIPIEAFCPSEVTANTPINLIDVTELESEKFTQADTDLMDYDQPTTSRAALDEVVSIHEDEVRTASRMIVDNPPVSPKAAESVNTSFHELLNSPRIEKRKTEPRRKSINYKGQRIIKSLFTHENNSTSEKPKKMKKKIEKKNKVKGHSSVPTNQSNSSWYCSLCDEDIIKDMRMCITCINYFHDECIGYTKDDKESFVCCDCDPKFQQ